jgi:hypothetical protein
MAAEVREQDNCWSRADITAARETGFVLVIDVGPGRSICTRALHQAAVAERQDGSGSSTVVVSCTFLLPFFFLLSVSMFPSLLSLLPFILK